MVYEITEDQLENMDFLPLSNNQDELKLDVAHKLQVQVVVGLFIAMGILTFLILISWFYYRPLLSKYYDSKQKLQKRPQQTASNLVNTQFTPITKDLDMKIRR